MEREILIYADLVGAPHLVGRLWTRTGGARESASFAYDRAWLSQPMRFALDPALQLAQGRIHAAGNRPLFGAIADSTPDRWGRMLMRRAGRHLSASTGNAPRTVREIDYLLGVDDAARLGALRFAPHEGGTFLAQADHGRIPPPVELPMLLAATNRVLDDAATDEDIQLLLAPGGALGGARPKASVRDGNGHLLIAKFPNTSDETDVVRWEEAALRLARKAGIEVARSRVEVIDGHSILLLERFDRKSQIRIPYLSAMSILSAAPHEDHSYLELADALRRYGASPRSDLQALWRRIVFNVLISNTDDHLRNHGFLYVGPQGWTLSPAFDLNPVPLEVKPRILSTAITFDDATASLELAMEVAEYFDVDAPQARKIVAEVGGATGQWRSEAAKLGISKAEIERMASAFDHADLAAARSIGR